MGPRTTRRRFLAGLGRAAGGLTAASLASRAPLLAQPSPALAQRFPDLRRHLIFEYYPWYGGPPLYEHWDYLERRPPLDLSTRYYPKLGPYDVRDRAVIEQHARWIAESGVGGVALSWWGRGSFMDRATPLIMDVMREHDLKVTFALEPYADDRGWRFADDILYLLREHGEKRGFDAFLLPANEDGRRGPVFKGFRCILPEGGVDCHGVLRPTSDYTPDHVWREQTDRLRETLRPVFDHVTLLADSLEFARTPASGFDGIGIYDNYIPPEDYLGHAEAASRARLLFSFNVNPGYDQIEPRPPLPDCYAGPRDVAPPGVEPADWTLAADRERAAVLSTARIAASLEATVAVQTDPRLTNDQRGFFIAYINSFNEWHEGHSFEPMKDAAELTPEERAQGYRNPARGDYRLRALQAFLRPLLRPVPEPRPQPPTSTRGFPADSVEAG
jgi:Glycosyl hydrolase family 99